jgi:phosphoglycolate phosphatase
MKNIPQFRLLVFDLDGTLVDSQVDLANSVNATLHHFNMPTLDHGIIASYIGDGVNVLVRRSLAHQHVIAERPDPHDDAFVEQAVLWFLDYYRVHMLDFTYVYPGVLESLTAIRNRHPDLPMAVLTNKPVNPSRAICRHFGLDRFLFANCGGNSFSTKKPSPEGLLTLTAQASALQPSAEPIAPADIVMIGDSHVDVETARAAGALSLGCNYGLSPKSLAAARPDLLVDHAIEWPTALGL